MRAGRWKLKFPLPGNPKAPDPARRDPQPLMLFDLEADPGEAKNVIERNMDIAKDLEERADKWTKSLGAIPKPKV